MTLKEKTQLSDVIEALDWAASQYDLNVETIKQQVLQRESTVEETTEQAMLYALNHIAMDEPNWTYVAARLYLLNLYKEAASNRQYNHQDKYGSFYHLIKTLTDQGIYSNDMMTSYTKEEIKQLEREINAEKDHMFNYIGLFLLADRYLARDHDGNLYELPQERFMIIAMTLMKQEEPSNRLHLVKEAYWALSNLYMTVATPTLTNAGKNYGQLSSCFIDTVEDSLDGIYLNNWDTARLSKDGGGIGIYFGKVRALGSDILKFKGNSSGVVPWIRLINDTAVSVDQLGQRQGAIAVYLDIFHKDIMNGFLDLKTNNGDERRKAHDIFTGVSVPDLFMKKLEEVDENGRSIGQWHTFCPHQVKQ
ncbi:MAG: ribonucleoside-diphosphate reductase subunit alpha, partial [Bacillaceae bacterium]|nr:ribonucleoside-diphosphate reductase subunit alpha [Bacillaceae bacterium]